MLLLLLLLLVLVLVLLLLLLILPLLLLLLLLKLEPQTPEAVDQRTTEYMGFDFLLNIDVGSSIGTKELTLSFVLTLSVCSPCYRGSACVVLLVPVLVLACSSTCLDFTVLLTYNTAITGGHKQIGPNIVSKNR